MKIAVIGTGTVGGTLGRRFKDQGYDVLFGGRSAGAEVKGGTPQGTRVLAVADAARDAEVIVLTVPWGGVPNVAHALGSVAGKVIVDVTNPLKNGARGLELDVGADGESGAERVAALLPAARVVKAFNQTGAENMANPVYENEPSVMFYAGDDDSAKAVVRDLVRDLGFDAIDAGPLRRSRELEHLAMLWISLAIGGRDRGIAFRLMRR